MNKTFYVQTCCGLNIHDLFQHFQARLHDATIFAARIRGFPYEDVFCRILRNSIECDKSLKSELGTN